RTPEASGRPARFACAGPMRGPAGAPRPPSARALASSARPAPGGAKLRCFYPPPRLLGSGPADPDAPGHAHALHVRGAAGVHGHDAVALLKLEESARRSPCGIGGESGRAHRIEDRLGHPETGHLAMVGELRPLVGARPLAADEP